jgi:hypothetical protein
MQHHQYSGRNGRCSEKGCTLTTERDHEARFFADPGEWPNWPVLPVKRWLNHDLECAFLTESNPSEPITLYIGTIFEVREAIMDVARRRFYPTFDDLYDDGWRVD